MLLMICAFITEMIPFKMYNANHVCIRYNLQVFINSTFIFQSMSFKNYFNHIA